jgi:heme/copper-type cytochrome/quinol oxidase subunit 4
MSIPNAHAKQSAENYSDSPARYFAIYVCVLILAGLQFYIASLNIDTSAMFVRMLIVAVVEAAVAIMFFMHLWGEKRPWFLFVVVITVFVMFALQLGWTDSNRMGQGGAPYSMSSSGAIRQ